MPSWRARDSRRSGGRARMMAETAWCCGSDRAHGKRPLHGGGTAQEGIGRYVCFVRGVAILGVLMATVAASVFALPPVVLVYGFQPMPGFRPGLLWEVLAEGLSGSDLSEMETLHVSHDHRFYRLPAREEGFHDVYLSHVGLPYEPTWRDLRLYVERFSEEMRFLREEIAVERCHVVGHSMGGLIARAYIERDDIAAVMDPVYAVHEGADVHTLILLATPNHGSPVAQVGEAFSALGEQLSPGSALLAMLNVPRYVEGRLTSIVPTVRYVSLAGQSCLGCGLRVDRDQCLAACVREGLAWAGSDLVVMMASAYLPDAENCAMIG
ncbi:MAG TPA: hypothetical protein ENN96_02050, partial [Candidatus Acetothermia bacterium]|nr:hypothetical protein [Candidatus Acetothermia bacterium]